jgi:outer membrane protein assembly factor BamB
MAVSCLQDLPISSSPAIANGKVYVGSYDGNIYGFNLSHLHAITHPNTHFSPNPTPTANSKPITNSDV